MTHMMSSSSSSQALRLSVLSGHLNSNRTIGLRKQQRDFYEENGYLLLKNFISSELMDKCNKHFEDICEGRADRGMAVLFKDRAYLKDKTAKGQHIYNKIQEVTWDPVFENYVLDPKILDVVESLLGKDLLAFNTMLINKPPDTGTLTSEHPMHQDGHYMMWNHLDKSLAAWTAMQTVNQENGCLFVLPGTHRLPLLPHDYPHSKKMSNLLFHGVQGYENHPKVFLEMQKGDTVFFHSRLIHGSGPNLSKGFRRAMCCHYTWSGGKYYDVRGTIQENLFHEIQTTARKMGVIYDTPEEFMSARFRLVRGERLSL